MENKETTSPPKAIDDNSKLVHQFYFVKLWPKDPDSISKIKNEEKVVMKMHNNICEITERITEKMSKKEYIELVLNNRLNYPRDRRYSMAKNDKILLDLYTALDELNFRNIKAEDGGWFGEKLDKKCLNYLKLHGSKSLGEEKQILRDIRIQQKDVASFKSLEVLKETLSCNGGSAFFYHKYKNMAEKMRQRYHLNDQLKLAIEIEQFQNQHMERASNYDSLKKSIKDQIKLLSDEDCLGYRREFMECGIKIRNGVKELEAINVELNSLREKLSENYKKKYEACQRILNLKQLYLEETINYYQHCSYINKVHQLAEEKDVATLDEMSSSEVGKFMLEWNNNKAFREDYETNVLQSLERRQLNGDGRRRPDKSCRIMQFCNVGSKNLED